jgi:hypothetical protein
MGFTPGPWHYRPNEWDDWGVVKADRFTICQARAWNAIDEETLAQHRKAGTDPCEANARLIAAAPDLYEALEMVRDADEDCHKDGLPTIPPAARQKIDAALAKARGETK